MDCNQPDCKWGSMWHTHPSPTDVSNKLPITVSLSKPERKPKINLTFPKTPKAIFNIQEVMDYHESCANNYSRIIKGSQWPDSLKDFSKPLELQHRFYAWIFSLAVS